MWLKLPVEGMTAGIIAFNYVAVAGYYMLFWSKRSVICSVIHDCRLHTLAYVESSEKLYAFGSGENGQLGNNKVVTINSPVVVENSWVANDRKSHCRVQRIATGGDHCYVVTLKNVSNLTLILWPMTICLKSGVQYISIS